MGQNFSKELSMESLNPLFLTPTQFLSSSLHWPVRFRDSSLWSMGFIIPFWKHFLPRPPASCTHLPHPDFWTLACPRASSLTFPHLNPFPGWAHPALWLQITHCTHCTPMTLEFIPLPMSSADELLIFAHSWWNIFFPPFVTIFEISFYFLALIKTSSLKPQGCYCFLTLHITQVVYVYSYSSCSYHLPASWLLPFTYQRLSDLALSSPISNDTTLTLCLVSCTLTLF